MFFYFIFGIPLIGYILAILIYYSIYNKTLNNISKAIISRKNISPDTKGTPTCEVKLTNFENKVHINTAISHIKNDLVNNLCIIFIIPIIIYLLFLFIIKKYDMEENKTHIYILFLIKIGFCSIIIYNNNVNNDKDDLSHIINDLKTYDTEDDNKNIIQMKKNTITNYYTVYGTEIGLTIFSLLLLIKYEDISEKLEEISPF